MTSGVEVTLAIDGSASLGTVAVLRGDLVAAQDAVPMRGEEEDQLFPAIAEALRKAGCGMRDLTRVVCGAGPGSFTSLRVVAAIAKGVALGNSMTGAPIPLYAASSLTLIIAGADALLPPGRYLALLDAMRGERYAQLVEVAADGRIAEMESAIASRISAADVAVWCERYQATAAGPLESLPAAPHARGVARLLGQVLGARAVDLDSWEPTYGRLAEAQVRWEAQQGRALLPDRA